MMGEQEHNRHWIARHVGAEAFETLAAGLAEPDLQSVLLGVMHRRAGARTPKELVAQYGRDPFCTPAAVDLRESVAIDAHLLAAAEGFEAIELSPVAPLGVSSVVAPTDQNRVLSALRTTEVVSDTTNVLALECARRLRADRSAAVHLATSHRVVRAQPFPKQPGHSQHFRLFALASGGLETPDHGFTVGALVRHIRALLAAFDRLEEEGYSFGERRVEVLTTPQRDGLGDRVAEALGGSVTRSVLDHPYYSGGLRYKLWVTPPGGEPVPLVDGGTFDWLGQLLSDRRAVFVATGAGSQLIALRFRASS
ncbi:MAG TPA: hypothetical protein VK610_01815 [Rhodothermales bacterium]|nr:hypothetical protein [Rhodothermales bacterium]